MKERSPYLPLWPYVLFCSPPWHAPGTMRQSCFSTFGSFLFQGLCTSCIFCIKYSYPRPLLCFLSLCWFLFKCHIFRNSFLTFLYKRVPSYPIPHSSVLSGLVLVIYEDDDAVFSFLLKNKELHLVCTLAPASYQVMVIEAESARCSINNCGRDK